MMMVARNSHARKGGWGRRGGRCRGTMKKLVGKRKGMLTTGEWCNSVSNMLHHV